jgi:NADPH2:quinone reductase
MLATRAKLRPSERLLITGAAGALGSMAIQVAKLLGATVIAAAGADERVAFARTLGADVGINYRATDLPAEIARLVGEVDAVLETTGDPTVWSGALASIAQGGRLVSCAAHGGGTVPLDVKRLYSRRLTVLGSAGSNATDVSWALAKAEAGELRPHIARTLPLRQAADAHRLVESNQVLGKVILQPADD